MKTRKKKKSKADPEVVVASTPVVDEPPAADIGTETGSTEAPSEDWQDQYLRLAAEFDNFRKRSARDFQSMVQHAEGVLISDLTEVVDNLGRALDTDHQSESVDEFAKGIVLIRDQLWKALESRGLKKMDTVGTVFDPASHDAMMRAPSDEHDEGVIIQEISPGYSRHDKVLRHARVIVSQGKSDTSEGE
jgi:molecular chaperone GrpE